MASPIISLDLRISGVASPYTLAATLRDLASASDIELAGGVPLEIDTAALLERETSPREYGSLLAAAVFASRVIWDRAESYAAGKGADLRLRLCIAEEAATLHALRWERLCDPAGDPIAAGGRVALLRYVPTSNPQPVLTPTADALRALIAVACPSDAPRYGLSAFDTASELASAQRALADAPWLAALAPDAPLGRATPARLNELLRRGCDLLYLVCHGTLGAQGEPTLWLEQDDGSAARLSGAELIRQLAALDEARRPLMVILAACHSAGSGDPVAATAALGVQLARAGVPAVIAMQGLAPVDLIARFMPVVLRELLQHCAIDRAVAVARADLPLDDAWWLPVLYTRVESGRLCDDPLPPPPAPLSIHISSEAPRSQVAALGQALAMRGLILQPDLSQADGALLHATADDLDDERGFEAAVEKLRHARRERSLPVIVLRDGVTRRALRPFVNPADLGWVDVERDLTAQGTAGLGAVAAEALRQIVGSQATLRIRAGRAALGLRSFAGVTFDSPQALLLAWESAYQDGRYPDPEVWRTQLLPALADLRQALKAHGLRQIDLTGRARLGAGLALGYAFREVTETVIRVKQGPGWWRTVPHDARLAPCGDVQPQILGEGADLTVELNVNRDPGEVSAFVNAYLRDHALPVGQRLRLEPTGGPSAQISERDAQAIAAQVRTLIQRHRRPGGETHLFMSAPLGMAVLIGWHLNALTPVQYYELPEGGKGYEPACRLVTL
ncbi:SAVED domain-containing protein [Oscillochloris sp. ZM17-4]|uniref:SAVED domain-containing protein n=1 Tax=Oscillochloris sp. ZM17-4 TaxID=2866714 RepID=UPI001C73C04A|nr:SAVED domain-containing protein [Oscillochloris sp. ZM17-4]MBX0331290.1 SAVED domain-containing protein [Oscillochloris sp. ZM17-4]